MYKEDLALNNQQWLICHKIKPHIGITTQDLVSSIEIQTLYILILNADVSRAEQLIQGD